MMKKILFLAVLLAIGTSSYAQPLITATVPNEYCPGESFDVTINVTGLTAQITAFGASIWTPTEWGEPTIVAGSASAHNFILIEGSGLTQTGWIPSASTTRSVTYRWIVPIDWSGTTVVSNQGEWRGLTNSDRFWTVITDHQVAECDPQQARYHSADMTEDYIIDLTELLRVIQFFNLLSFHCDGTSEDGYNPGPGDTTCTHHDADYSADGVWGVYDWTIALTELLRMIQIFNLGGYHYCPDDITSEDDFCVGLL